MICAKHEKVNDCGGFEGDPMICETARSGYQYLCGILSLAVRRSCTRIPDVYVDVSKYQRWIQNHTQAVWQEYQCKKQNCLQVHSGSIMQIAFLYSSEYTWW